VLEHAEAASEIELHVACQADHRAQEEPVYSRFLRPVCSVANHSHGNDVFVWYVDENVQTTSWLGPSFYGGGGYGDAIWGDIGIDRLVLAIPTDTEIVPAPATPDGGLMVRVMAGDFAEDGPMAGQVYARYCGPCGSGQQGERTIELQYRSADGAVDTGYFGITAIEELQLGVGADAIVCAVDQTAGQLTPLQDSEPFLPPAWPDERCQ